MIRPEAWRAALHRWLPARAHPRRLLALFAVGLLLATTASNSQAPAGGERGLPVQDRSVATETGRVIVKYREGGAFARKARAGRTRGGHPIHAAALQQDLGLPLADGRVLGPRTQALRARGIDSAALAQRLRLHPEVEWAVPDERRWARALTNDPFLTGGQPIITPAVGQWYLRAPNATEVAAIDAVGAWDTTAGSAAITVAVLDTGVRAHPELVAKMHPGYDFVSSDFVANDPDPGRDADASDPGDYEPVGVCGNALAHDSSWHGTQVAGLIGASTHDGVGMASVGRNVMVLPVRVLGRCGGFDSDIIAAMRWAGGISDQVGVSAPVTLVNAHPARVINMSLGSPGACSAAYADVLADLAQAKVSVVVSAGNDNGLAVHSPGNCAGAITVAGLRHIGTKVGYSSVGAQVAIAAPAGNCINTVGTCLYPLLTTSNSGTTTPGVDSYSDGTKTTLGTSFAAPLVAGTAGLLLSLNPAMGPAQIKAALQAGATPFPTSGADPGTPSCRAPNGLTQLECYCTTGTCGAGMLNAAQALSHAFDPFALIASSTTTPAPGSVVNLDGRSSEPQAGRTITGYQWRLVDGASIASFSGATNGGTATVRVDGVGSVTVELAVTDSTGAIGRGTVTLTASSGSGSGAAGGGGAWGRGEAGLLALCALALAARRIFILRSSRQGDSNR